MEIPAIPKIGDTVVNEDGITLEYVEHKKWMAVDTEGYVRYKRVKEYPNIGDQLDMLFHEIENTGTISADGNWMTTIRNIKESYPKLEANT